MITPIDIVTQIRTYSKIFQLVGFTAELQRIMDEISTYQPELPACFVCFTNSDVSKSTDLNGYRATEYVNISVYVVLSTPSDITGSTAMTYDITEANADLCKCLLNWVPNKQSSMPISYEGYAFMTMSGSRTVYEVKFELEQQLTELDGFIPNYDTLMEIDIDSKYFKDGKQVFETETVSTK